MATHFQLQIPILFLLSIFISAAVTTTIPPSAAHHHDDPQETFHANAPALFPSILKNLGFQELSSAAVAANLSTGIPLTIFAPSDSSLLTCPSCSLPLILRQHSVPGLFPLHSLCNLAFGTKIETLVPNYCLTITTSALSINNDINASSSNHVFVDGVEITGPDLFNNGVLLIHGLQGFVTHLSPLSCNVERMTSISFPQLPTKSPTHFSIMRHMLKDAILRLRFKGYSVLSLALRMKFSELSELKAMTVFALDDIAVFSGGGPEFLSSFGLHVVPNRRITAAELVALPSGSMLETMETGQNLMVTTPGKGGQLSAPMKVNYIMISALDVLHNSRIVVHGLKAPFPHTVTQTHLHQHEKYDNHLEEGVEKDLESSYYPRCDLVGLGGGGCEVEATTSADNTR